VTFSALLHDVLRIRKTDTIYLLGDYIDRGPRSREVVDSILRLRQKGYSAHALRGNHDDMLLRACEDRDCFRVWLLNGGRTTLDSFGIEDPCDTPLVYKRFLSRLPYYFELEDFILVHAGLNRQADDPFSDKEAMLWARPSSINTTSVFTGKPIISGHTPVTKEAIINSLRTGWILLDNGCVYSSNQELGSLAALELNSLSLYFQKNID